MMRNPPFRLFGHEIWACYGVPAVVVGFAVVLIIVTMGEIASQVVKPVELTAIWAEPHSVSAAQVMAQSPGKPAVQLYKTGLWRRLCDVTAKQTFYDEHGDAVVRGEPHLVDSAHSTVGPFKDKHRGLQIPKLLAGTPGIYKVRVENYAACWPLERLIPIDGMSAEATFEITP